MLPAAATLAVAQEAGEKGGEGKVYRQIVKVYSHRGCRFCSLTVEKKREGNGEYE